MSALPEIQDDLNLLAKAEKWELARRVAASTHFQKSARLRDFLLYICEKTISNQREEVREQQIGVNVFNRPQDYNPSEDNIVRVEARELRKRLESYFAAEGRGEPVVIKIPKGAYIPVFEPRELVTRKDEPSVEPDVSAVPAKESPAPVAVPSAPPGQEKPPRARVRPSPAVSLLIGLVVLLSSACLWLWRENQTQRRLSQARPAPTPSARIWPLLFNSADQTLIAVSDVTLVLLQKLTNAEISLQDYLSHKYLANMTTGDLQYIASRQWTTVADLKIVRRMMELDGSYLAKSAILYPSNLRLQDLRTRNIILLGSRYANPWVGMFEERRNFRFEYDQQTKKSHYRNKSPRAGEETFYYNGDKNGNLDESYGVIAFLPNMSHNGNILIIEGNSSEGTEAAAELIINPALFSSFERQIGVGDEDGALPYFELLLKTRRLEGTFKEPVYVTHRLLSVQ